jgi:hypothetical protein
VLQNLLPGAPDLDDDASPVTWVGPPRDHAAPGEPIDQLDRAVMANLQPLGEDSDGHGLPALQALRLEQEESSSRQPSMSPDDWIPPGSLVYREA